MAALLYFTHSLPPPHHPPLSLSHTYTQSKVTILRLIAFVSPLMFVLGIQRFTRPMVNLLVARFSADKCEAATSVAVLTASYPLGHIAYGWINQVRPVPPAFQRVCIKILYLC